MKNNVDPLLGSGKPPQMAEVADYLDDFELTLQPFVELAKALLAVDNRHERSDDTPVFACNDKQITVGDCRRLLEVLWEL